MIDPPKSRTRALRRVAGPFVLFLLLAAVYGDAVLSSPMPVISGESQDAHTYFSVSRAFGYGEIARGNLPLWNPHVFSGVPYLAGIQAALFYPVNVIYLILPLTLAMNVDILFHLWFVGVGAYAWARGNGVSRTPAILAGAIFMLCAPYVLKVWAGHLTMLAAFSWGPYFFLAIDKTLQRPRLRYALIGVVAVTMIILAGYPQVAYGCALFAGIYLVFKLGALKQQPLPKLAMLAVIASMPMFLAAAQLGPTGEFAAESVRAQGVDREDSFEYSVYPHHLIRVIAPGFFGGTSDTPYWCAGYPLETGVFFGRIALMLTVFALFAGGKSRLPALAAISIAGVLALGPHAPLAPLFHEWVPGFDRFRAPGRYWIFVVWFGAMLAATALHNFLAGNAKRRTITLIACAGAVAAWGLYIWVHIGVGGLNWARFVDHVGSLGREATLTAQEVATLAAESAPSALLSCAIIVTTFAAIVSLPMRTQWRGIAIVGLACLELALFARAHRQLLDPAFLVPEESQAYVASRNAETRVLNLANNNEAMRAGAYDISGYEPGMPIHMHEFLSHPKAGLFTRRADGGLEGNAVASLLRCGAVIGPNIQFASASGAQMPRFSFVTRYEVIPDSNALLERLYDPAFDPSSTVLLKTDPGQSQQAIGDQVAVTILDQSTDHVTLEVEVPVDGLLMCTDAYSTGWRASSLQGSSQAEYEVMPAHHALRAIPLRAGSHRLRMYYEPETLVPGLWISIVAACVLNGLLVVAILRGIRKRFYAGTSTEPKHSV